MKEQKGDLISIALSKLKDEDFTHRGFLKPLQIQLKTYKTEYHTPNSKLKPTSLPGGLKIAHKQCIYNNKYELQNVTGLNQKTSTQVQDARASKLTILKTNYQDNILTLMKEEAGIELAICICMYSEDKKMLKSTLAGVAENISNIVSRQGISSDKIGVFVLMDGIEKVDESVVDYFEELERMNNINLGDNIAPTLSVEEMARRAKTMTPDQINQMELKNVNNFLFDAAELQDRNERRFFSVHSEYKSIKNLQKTIETLKKGKPLYEDLPIKLREFFINEAREQYKKDYAQTEEVVKQLSEQKLLNEYGTDLRKIRPLILRTLNEGERYCRDFISSREDLAYLGTFRNKVRHGIDKLPKKQNHKYSDTEQELYDQLEVDKFYTYMNLFMCVKYKNSGKLSSHNWFFNGFCKELKPKYAVLLDVGLKPEEQALFKMYRYMKSHKNVGGVCGYMSLKIQKVDESEEVNEEEVDFLTNISLKFVDIQRTQQVEYHFAHLMDKAFESSFGFIHVLPGAFSAYNMAAIINYNQDDDELLKSYFKSIDQKLKNSKILSSELTISNVLLRILLPDLVNSCCLNINPESQEQMLYNENIYLAEDRILCMGIHKKGFDMTYLPDAYAEVDPIKTVHGLLGQRKRWINGSFFAFEKVKKQLGQHEKQKGFECMLHLQMFYLTLMNALSYLAPAFFLFTVHIAMEAFRADVLPNVFTGLVNDPTNNQFYNGFVYTMDFIYVVLIMSIVFFSLHLTNSNKKFKPYLYVVSTLFGVFSIVVFAVLVVDVIRGLIDSSAFLIENQKMAGDVPGGMPVINALRWILVGTTGIYVVPILLYVFLFRKPNILWEIVMGAFSFLFYGPTYLNILNIYSLCRIDDISWGTKGLESGSGGQNSKLKDSWKLIKFIHVSKYVFWNIIVAAIILSFGSSYTPRFFITIIIIAIMGTSLSLKILIALLYMIKYKLSNSMCCVDERPPRLEERSRIQDVIDDFKGDITNEIHAHLQDMKNQYLRNPMFKQGGSFIQASRTKKNVEKSYQKQKKENDQRSNIIPKQSKKISMTNSRVPPKPLSKIEEVDEGPSNKKRSTNKPRNELNMSDSNMSDSPEKKSEDHLMGPNQKKVVENNLEISGVKLNKPENEDENDNGNGYNGFRNELEFKQKKKSQSQQKKYQNKNKK